MKIKLPIIGQIKTGKDAVPVIERVEIEKKDKSAFLGTFLDFNKNKLSDEKTVSTKLLQTYSEWIYANVSTLAEEVSKLEPQLFKMVLRGGQVEFEEVDSHPILDLLDRFNESTTSSDAFYVTEAHLELAGDAFYYVDGPTNDPNALFILQPDKMELILGDYTDASARLIDGYKYTVTTDGRNRVVEYSPDEIIHIKVPNPNNPYRGKSVVEAAAKSIDTDEAITEALINFFRNGMIANFALTTDQNLNEDQIKQLEAQLKSKRSGVKNAFSVPILSGGLDVKPIQMSNKEVELIALEEWFRDKIMAMFNNTKASLGITDDVNRANAEATLLGWKRSVIVPKMGRIIDALNEFLLPRYGDNLILGFKDPIPEDRGTKIKELAILVDAGVLTPNEAREELEYEPTEGGDDLKGSGNIPIPTELQYINYKSVFRRNGWYKEVKDYKVTYAASYEAAKSMIKEKKEAVVVEKLKRPSQKKVINFWKRVAQIIEEYEEQFRNKAIQLIEDVVEQATVSLEDEQARAAGELFDREQIINKAVDQFKPLLLQAMALAGTEANRLIGVDSIYVPALKQLDAETAIREQIEQWAGSMLDTDKDVLATVIAQGLEKGDGIPVIRRAIQAKFAEFSKTQAERITRSEVALSANRGILDAYERSGVVEAKQWLTAPGACEFCEPLNGEIVELSGSYFDKGSEYEGAAGGLLKLDYRDIEEPPLHPNCRCTTIAVIEGLDPLIEPKNFNLKMLKDHISMQEQIKELEAKIDKRTKKFRAFKKKAEAEKVEDVEYIKKLEELVYEDGNQTKTSQG